MTTLLQRLTELEALTDNNRSWQAKENMNFLLALRNAWPELKLALARQEQGEGMVMVPRKALQMMENARDQLWTGDSKDLLTAALDQITNSVTKSSGELCQSAPIPK